jgi:hypothetical protein
MTTPNGVMHMRILVIMVWMLGVIAIAQAEAARKPDPDPMPGAPKDECVFVRNISNWRVLDSRHLVLFTPNATRAYLARLGTPATDLKHAFKVAFIDRDRDGQLCGRSPDRVQAIGSLVEQPATIMGMTRLDETGLQALEAHYDVKLTRRRKIAEQSQEGTPSDIQ